MKNTKIFLKSLISRKGLPPLILSLFLVATIAVSLFYINWQTDQSQRATALGNELQLLSKQVPLEASQSTNSADVRGIPDLMDKVANQVDTFKEAGWADKVSFIPKIKRESLQAASTGLDTLRQATSAYFASNFMDPQAALYPASKAIDKIGEGLKAQATGLQRSLKPFYWLVIAAAGLLLLFLIVLGSKSVGSITESSEELEGKSSTDQDAILRLLDEMGDLADGDLTVSATVTEDITGAIADSINYTVDALRNLVENINSTSQQVVSAAQETQATSMHMSDASTHQAAQISEVNKTFAMVADAMGSASENASQSAEVASQSVSLATKGNEAVQKSISGMNTIREQIQETSKRIKRLGESSQEIGEIVELINDISEQTNILSLNASIQAAMAGEAGRGFAVVADEVQRLAERSGKATKQIDALVKTIQSDTNEAISSMERSTSEVVLGAELSQDAGASLEKIQLVSKQLATMIQSISSSTKEQEKAAGNTSAALDVIEAISLETVTGTSDNAEGIGRLLDLVQELRRSVSGFKLPDTKA